MAKRQPGKKRSSLRPSGSTHGKSRKTVQGSELPADGGPIAAYPTGCCVLADLGGGLAWHMVLFRIGGQGAPHCGRLASDPHVAGWNAGMGLAREVSAGTIVVSSCWPFRPSTDEGAELDPFAGSDRSSGAIMFNHMNAGRSP